MASEGAIRRGRLDRAGIVAAARDLLDEGGAESFSMTRLGAHLGVTTMALYRHVADRGDLEQALVEHVFLQFAEVAPTSGEWGRELADWMRALRSCWLAHPWVGSLIATRTDLSPAWLLVLDNLAVKLAALGLTPAQVARELERVSRTTIGILRQEVSAPLPYRGLTDAALTHLPPAARARWRAIQKTLSGYSNDDLFEDMIAGTLDRLRASVG
jgi:AcrR family transcriptional regulator